MSCSVITHSFKPTAVLQLAVVLERNEQKPTAVLLAPVVFKN
jgi:precorrin isomerase